MQSTPAELPTETPPIYEEIEAKFRVTDAHQARVLRTMPTLAERYKLGAVSDVVNVDTYYDADDLRLLRQGQTLRVRSVGDTVLMTAKSISLHNPKGMHTRNEIERPAPFVEPDAPLLRLSDLPEDLLAGVGDLLEASTRLRPLVRLHQARAKRDVMATDDPEATRLAELSLDEVTVLRDMGVPAQGVPAQGGADAERWRAVSHFCTLEVELDPNADRDALREIALWLRAWPGLEADDQNKLQQALLALHVESADEQEIDHAVDHAREPDHREHMAELCRRVWGEQLTVMLVNEAGVRFADDIEYVHDMRVATRRARAAGRLYAGYFDPGSRKVKRFMRRLRTTGRRLGRVRDLDVALQKLQAFAGNAEAAGKGTQALAEAWTHKRQKAHAQLVEWLDSKEYQRFATAFVRFCATPGAGVARFHPTPGQPPTPHQVRHVLPSLILGRYEAIRAFEVLFEQARAEGTEIPIETLHALRIECKYMRYHLEFSAALLGRDSAGLIERLKGLQEHLGDLNDASVSSALLAHTPAAALSDGIADYAALQATTQEALRHSLPTDLDAFLAEETRRTLALALARI